MNPDARKLGRFIARAGRVAVVTGAGVSTASGIPDYRDRNGDWKHARPVQFADFVSRAEVRQRYWARSFAGWGRIANALPNPAHEALAALEAAGRVDTLITQNVDGLHHRAGSRRVIDLHGRLQTVLCMGCGIRFGREQWQEQLAAANPSWRSDTDYFAPDGDAMLRDEDHAAAFLDRHHMKLFYGSDCNDKDGQGDKCSGSQQLSTVRKLVPDRKKQHAILFGNANRVIFGNHG